MRNGTMVASQVTREGDGGGQAGVAGWCVPGYTGLKSLGSGGFGDVVLARHDGSGTLVAIKYLRPNLLSDAWFAEMFRGEAAVLASMDDPHVVRLYEYVESPSGAAIVMELVDGVSLRQILARQGGTTPEAALVVLQGSLLGLAAAHARRVVHRDYKPDNVLVDGDGASKLTDFGIAARAGDQSARGGTLAYAPPEQFAGGSASPAGDVYAATATFFECLTGRPPFRGDTAAALLYQHLSEPVPVDAVPGPVRPLVAAGMAKQPEDRPADATTFVAALNEVAAGAYGPDWHDRGRSHLAEAALLLAALWPSGGPGVQGTTVEKIPLHQRDWRSRLRRSGRVKKAIAAAIVVAIAVAGTVLAFRLARSGSHPVTLPAVSGVSPASGSTMGGSTVTITGTGLAGATVVRFGGAAGTIRADSGTQITVISPPSTGTVTTAAITADSGRQITAADRRRHREHHRDHPGRHLAPHRRRPLHLHRPTAGDQRRIPGQRQHRGREHRDHHRDRAGRCHRRPFRRRRRSHHRRFGHADHRDQPAWHGHRDHHRDHPGRHLAGHRRRPLHLYQTAETRPVDLLHRPDVGDGGRLGGLVGHRRRLG